jgi:hypothetical protein
MKHTIASLRDGLRVGAFISRPGAGVDVDRMER